METYDAVDVAKHVIMPNHIHMIIVIAVNGGGRTQFAPTISRVIKQFKGSITKQIGFSLWQRSYHDHIIRDEKEYLRIAQYIQEIRTHSLSGVSSDFSIVVDDNGLEPSTSRV